MACFTAISDNDGYDRPCFISSAAVAKSNPIELQTGPGRTFMVSFDKTF